MKPSLKHDWQSRREELILALCQDIRRATARGETLKMAVRVVRRKYRGRSLGGGRKLRLSTATIHRQWYNYRVNPRAFNCRLRYLGKARKLEAYAVFLAAYFAASESMSAPQVYRLLAHIDPDISFCYRTLARCLRPSLTRKVSQWKQCSMSQSAAWWEHNTRRISSALRNLSPRHHKKEITHDD
jgi:hypothetical protein